MSRVLLLVLLGTFMSTASNGCKSNPHSTDPGPSGASAAFTTDDPIVKQAQALMKDGKFKEAQSLLASDDGHADATVEEARSEMKEIIRRTRREYSQSADDVLK